MFTKIHACRIAVAGLLLATGCSSLSASPDTSDEASTYSLGPTACSLQSTLSLSNDPTVKWSGCLVHYDADARVVTWQLLPASGGSGSLLAPAANVLVFSFDSDAPENATFDTARIVSPLPASVPSNQTVFAFGTANGRDGGVGNVTVGSNVIDPNGGGGALSGNVSIKLTNGATVTGSFQANAQAQAASSGASASSGSDGESGGCADNGASCKSNCANGGQYACYCAAAATAACFLAHGCYAEAGAATSVTKAKLQGICSTSLGQASSLGGGTCGGLSCN